MTGLQAFFLVLLAALALLVASILLRACLTLVQEGRGLQNPTRALSAAPRTRS